jgi:hypothetical protein
VPSPTLRPGRPVRLRGPPGRGRAGCCVHRAPRMLRDVLASRRRGPRDALSQARRRDNGRATRDDAAPLSCTIVSAEFRRDQGASADRPPYPDRAKPPRGEIGDSPTTSTSRGIRLPDRLPRNTSTAMLFVACISGAALTTGLALGRAAKEISYMTCDTRSAGPHVAPIGRSRSTVDAGPDCGVRFEEKIQDEYECPTK